MTRKAKVIKKTRLALELAEARKVEFATPAITNLDKWRNRNLIGGVQCAREFAVRWREELLALMNARGLERVEAITLNTSEMREVKVPGFCCHAWKRFVLYTVSGKPVAYRLIRGGTGSSLNVVGE